MTMRMARLSKLDLAWLIFRGYGTQRCQNYYEILEVTPDCSQKEIRSAFITLSKKFHPDIIGKEGHNKFVMVQEAYNVLSKEHTRRQYDMSLKYNTHSFSANPNPRADPNPYRVYRAPREWEERMARGNWEPNYDGKEQQSKVPNSQFIMLYIMIGVVFVFLNLMMVNQGLSRVNLLQTKYQREYNELRGKIKGLTKEEQLRLIRERIRLAEEEEQNRRKYNGK